MRWLQWLNGNIMGFEVVRGPLPGFVAASRCQGTRNPKHYNSEDPNPFITNPQLKHFSKHMTPI